MTLYSCSHQGKRPRTTYLAADAVVGIGLAGLADWAGHAQLPLQLVAGVAEAGVQQRAPSIRPAVGLARAACDVVRAVALGGDLLVGRAAAAVHARAVRVLVGARCFERGEYRAQTGIWRLLSFVSVRTIKGRSIDDQAR